LRYDRDNVDKIRLPFLGQFPQLRYKVCLLKPEEITLADESGMIRTQKGSTIDQKMVAVA
jgi:hypothetical protein